ncbi:MAG: D-alanyl-D-alanine carboxypeptidase family protein [Rickettsiales bacterium]
MVNFKVIISILATLMCISQAQALETAAKQAILIDAESGEVLYQKNEDEQMAPSSMSKIMTAYIAFEKLKSGEITLDTEVPISKKAWETGGSKTFVHVDTKVRFEDLMRGMVVQSGNDATIALAEGIAGSEEAFADLMNAKATQLGLTESHFANSTGLPNDEHYMTARDLATLGERLVKDFPENLHYFSETEFTYNGITQPNRNTLLGEYGIDGLKTGYTEKGGYGLVATSQKDGMRLIAVVNGLKKEQERLDESKKLLAYGFANFKKTLAIKKGAEIARIPLWYGSDSEIIVTASDDINLVGSAITASELEKKVEYSSPLVAPITKGQKIAELTILSKGRTLLKKEIVAEQDYERGSIFKRGYQNAKYKLKELLSGLST